MQKSILYHLFLSSPGFGSYMLLYFLLVYKKCFDHMRKCKRRHTRFLLTIFTRFLEQKKKEYNIILVFLFSNFLQYINKKNTFFLFSHNNFYKHVLCTHQSKFVCIEHVIRFDCIHTSALHHYRCSAMVFLGKIMYEKGKIHA